VKAHTKAVKIKTSFAPRVPLTRPELLSTQETQYQKHKVVDLVFSSKESANRSQDVRDNFFWTLLPMPFLDGWN
jgi:hypothetical protein